MTEEQKKFNPEERLSKEELQRRRDEVTNFYKEQIPHLEVQVKYENLLKDIELARAERLRAQLFVAQTMAKAPEGEDGEEDETDKQA